MRKGLAILLMCLMLFNWVGYQMYIAIMVHYSGKELAAKLDKHNYSDADLISIKVPVTYIYYNGYSSFQRIDGQVELNGTTYNYVKRRFFNDSLELLCIPNVAATKLKSAQDAYFALSNGLDRSHDSKKADDSNAVFKYMMQKYCPSPGLEVNVNIGDCYSITASRYRARLVFTYLPKVVQPPDQA